MSNLYHLFAGNNKPATSKISKKFNEFDRTLRSDLIKSVKRTMKIEDRNKLDSALKPHMASGVKKSFRQIFTIVKKEHGYAFGKRIEKKIKDLDTQSGLTKEQIKRNINYLRLQRGDKDVDRFRSEVQGVSKGANLVARMNSPLKRYSSSVHELIQNNANPLNKNRRVVGTASSLGISGGLKANSVGNFASAHISPETNVVSINQARKAGAGATDIRQAPKGLTRPSNQAGGYGLRKAA